MAVIARFNILGIALNLIGNYTSGQHVLLVLDAEEPAQQAAHQALSAAMEEDADDTPERSNPADQEIRSFLQTMANDNAEVEQSLLQQLKVQLGESFQGGTVQNILELFSDIRLKDLALQWGLKGQPTIWHFQFYMKLKVKIKTLGFEIRYLCLDFTQSTHATASEEEKEKALKDISDFKANLKSAKATASGSLKWQQQIEGSNKGILGQEQALQQAGLALNQISSLEQVTALMGQQEKALSEAEKTLQEPGAIEKATNALRKKQDWFEEPGKKLRLEERIDDKDIDDTSLAAELQQLLDSPQ